MLLWDIYNYVTTQFSTVYCWSQAVLHCTLQAILFYIPRWLWKNWEAGKVSALRMDLNLGIISDVEKKLKKKLLIDYLYSNLKHHNFWAYRYFFCEFLALLNVSGENISFYIFFQSKQLVVLIFCLRQCMVSKHVTVRPLLAYRLVYGKYK